MPIGVKDNGNIAGIRSDEEFYMVEQAAEMYCKPAQDVVQTVYCIEGKYVLLVKIQKSTVPVLAQDDNHKWQPYYRVNDENIQVPDLLLRVWKSRKRKSASINFSESEARLLDFVSKRNGTSVMDIARSLHFSVSYTENAVVALCALDVLDFYYDGSKWLIVTTGIIPDR